MRVASLPEQSSVLLTRRALRTDSLRIRPRSAHHLATAGTVHCIHPSRSNGQLRYQYHKATLSAHRVHPDQPNLGRFPRSRSAVSQGQVSSRGTGETASQDIGHDANSSGRRRSRGGKGVLAPDPPGAAPSDVRLFFLPLRRVKSAERRLHARRNEIFNEYAEMATQFGYLTLFGVVWPISPLWSLINNVVRVFCRFPGADCSTATADAGATARNRSKSVPTRSSWRRKPADRSRPELLRSALGSTSL